MANHRNRCPYCGRFLNRAGYGLMQQAGPESEAYFANTVNASRDGNIGRQWLNNPVLKSCCSPMEGCRIYDVRNRDTFWPNFCHPRWLSCSQLYNRR